MNDTHTTKCKVCGGDMPCYYDMVILGEPNIWGTGNMHIDTQISYIAGNNLNNVYRLPLIRFKRGWYFVDKRLKEYRHIKNPHDKITFDDMSVIFQYLDIGGELMKAIEREAQKLGIRVIGGQSMLSNEEITHLITPDGEVFTIIRDTAPDEEAIEQITGEVENDK